MIKLKSSFSWSLSGLSFGVVAITGLSPLMLTPFRKNKSTPNMRIVKTWQPQTGLKAASRDVAKMQPKQKKDMAKTRHVVHNPEGGWDSKKGGATKASKHFDTKEEAENYSREVSRKEKSELFIHGKDGKIQRKDSHGNDDFPPRG